MRSPRGTGGMHDSNPLTSPFLLGANTRFRRFYRWLVKANAHGHLRPRGCMEDSVGQLFPCALPYPEALQAKGCWKKSSDGARLLFAKEWVNLLFAWGNYVSLGLPEAEGSYEPQVGFCAWNTARHCAEHLLGEVLVFTDEDLIRGKTDLDKGRALLEEFLSSMPSLKTGYVYPDSNLLQASTTVAMDVDPSRIGIPDEAGMVDPLHVLPPERQAVYRDLSRLQSPVDEWGVLPAACHRVPEEREDALVERLLKSRMVELVPEEHLPHDKHGGLLVGGLFAVGKNESEDRLIYDRRPQNAISRRLKWAQLPAGACYTKMLLEPHQYLRGSGDDLRNFYYCLSLPDNFVHNNAVGRRVNPRIVADQGLDPTVAHRMCFRVLGMGDSNACDLAQGTHEAVLKAGGLLEAEQLLRYGFPPPRSKTWQGCYLDDLLITQVCDLPVGVDASKVQKFPESRACDPDVKLVLAAEEAYRKVGLKRAEHKAFRQEIFFKTWGAEIDGQAGTAAAPLKLRRQTWKLIQMVLKGGWCGKHILQQLMGYVGFAFQYRRELYSLAHHIYKYIDGLQDGVWYKLPPQVCDELRSIALHLPTAQWRMRRSISKSLLATDATPTSGGSTRARISKKLARTLFDWSVVRGSDVCLDTQTVCGEEVVTRELERHVDKVNDLGDCLHWKVTGSYEFRRTSHVNLQELRAIKVELNKMGRAGTPIHQVQPLLCDSQVCCAVLSKGRSSSYKLNGILRSMLPTMLVLDVCFAANWIGTKHNPADHPSRGAPLPPPLPPPKWFGEVDMKEPVFTGWEIFAGSARLTKAHNRHGFRMRSPVDVLYQRDAFDPEIEKAIRRGEVNWLWLAPPCKSFSALRNLDKGGPLRPRGKPQGDSSNPEVQLGNRLWERAIYLAKLVSSYGGYVTIEHPLNSKAWQLPSTRKLATGGGFWYLQADWCAYHTGRSQPNKKPTKFLTSMPWLADACKTCPKNHTHGKPLRGERASKAAAYPWKFCRALASSLERWKDGQAEVCRAVPAI